MAAIVDGYVLRREMDSGDVLFYTVDEGAGVDYIFAPADMNTVLKVYLTQEEAEGALYEALYLYQKEGYDVTDIENTYVVPYFEYMEEIEELCLEIEEG